MFRVAHEPHVTSLLRKQGLDKSQSSSYRPIVQITWLRPHCYMFLDSMFIAMNDKKITAIIALDMSAAFDIENHSILLRCPHCNFGISGVWLEQVILIKQETVSKAQPISICLHPCILSVRQASVLGPIIKALYVAPVGDIISSLRDPTPSIHRWYTGVFRIESYHATRYRWNTICWSCWCRAFNC